MRTSLRTLLSSGIIASFLFAPAMTSAAGAVRFSKSLQRTHAVRVRTIMMKQNVHNRAAARKSNLNNVKSVPSKVLKNNTVVPVIQLQSRRSQKSETSIVRDVPATSKSPTRPETNVDSQPQIVPVLPTEAINEPALTEIDTTVPMIDQANTTDADDVQPSFTFTPAEDPVVPPRVAGVYVRGSGWNSGYLNLLETSNLGKALNGYRLLDGTNQIANAGLVTWQTVDQISVTFSEDVTINANSFRLVGSNNQEIALATTGGFSYAPATHTATWTLASPLTRDKFLMMLDSSKIVNAGAALDGEWVTSSTTYSTSGDGTAGGNFNFRFNYLPGDVSLNGQTNIGDVSLLRSQGAMISSADNFRSDVTANNQINTSDVGVIRGLGIVTLSGLPEPTGIPTGNLYITKSATPVRSHQLLGGTLGDDILRLQLSADTEDIDVTNIVFTQEGNQDNSVLNLDRLELYAVGSTTPFAMATVAGCGTDAVPAFSLCAKMQNQQLVILKGTNKNILVRPLLRTDAEGAVSGQFLTLSIDGVAGVKARGLSSSNSLALNDGDGVAEGEVFIGTSVPTNFSQTIFSSEFGITNHVVVLSNIVSITNASPDVDGTSIPNGSQRAIGQFKFTAAANNNSKNGRNKVVLSDIIFNLNASNVELDSGSFKFYSKADPSIKHACVALNGVGQLITAPQIGVSGQIFIQCEDMPYSPIGSGEDRTFVLEATTTRTAMVSSQSSELQVSLRNFNISDPMATFGFDKSHIQWVDEDASGVAGYLWIEYPETIIWSTKYEGEAGAADTTSPKVESVVVGDGTSSRSGIKTLTINFDEIITADPGAFTVKKRGSGGGIVGVSLVTSTVANKTVATLTFSSPFVYTSKALEDGNYDLMIDASKVNDSAGNSLDGDANGSPGGNYLFGTIVQDAFFSFFGDGDGDRDVDSSDFDQFKLAYGKSSNQSGYRLDFDFEANGTIGVSDFNEFRKRHGKTLPFVSSETGLPTGNLYITKSSTPVRSRQLLGGTLTDEIMRLQFLAEYEDIDVTDLVLTATGPNASMMNTNIDRLELYKVGETVPFATASVSGCGTSTVPSNSMCASLMNQELVIAKGSTTNILVRPRMRTDVQGAISGHNVQVMIDAVAGAKARGLASSNTLAQNDSDTMAEGEVFIATSSPGASQTITGNDNVVVLSKVMSITNADPNANGTAIPTGLQRQIAQFKFSAAAANNVKNGSNKWTLSKITFNLSAQNVLLGSGDQTATATSDFKIYNKADPAQKSVCTANQASASDPSLLVTCTDISSIIASSINPGTDLTFVLEAEVVNAKISNSSSSMLQVSLQNFTDIQASVFSPAGSHLEWLDEDNGASAPFLWIEYPDTSINGTEYQG